MRKKLSIKNKDKFNAFKDKKINIMRKWESKKKGKECSRRKWKNSSDNSIFRRQQDSNTLKILKLEEGLKKEQEGKDKGSIHNIENHRIITMLRRDLQANKKIDHLQGKASLTIVIVIEALKMFSSLSKTSMKNWKLILRRQGHKLNHLKENKHLKDQVFLKLERETMKSRRRKGKYKKQERKWKRIERLSWTKTSSRSMRQKFLQRNNKLKWENGLKKRAWRRENNQEKNHLDSDNLKSLKK